MVAVLRTRLSVLGFRRISVWRHLALKPSVGKNNKSNGHRCGPYGRALLARLHKHARPRGFLTRSLSQAHIALEERHFNSEDKPSLGGG